MIAARTNAMPRLPARTSTPPVRSPNTATVALGWLPALTLTGAFGVLCVAIAYTGSRFGIGQTEILFWVGVLTIFLPTAMRLAMQNVSREERIGCVLLMALGLYAVKLLHSPLGFGNFDELLHLRTENDIVRSHHLLQANPLLPVSPIFSGLENCANAVTNISGVLVFGAGIFTVGAARFVLMSAMFLLFEEVAQSARTAGIALVLYMTNGNFMFFDAQFAYETYAIAFALFALYCFVRSLREHAGARAAWLAVSFIGISVTVVSHHVTSYFFLLFLLLWCAVRSLARSLRISQYKEEGPSNIAIVTTLMCLAWVVYVAMIVISYLSEPIGNGFREFARLIAGEQKSRQLFKAEGGYVQAEWEQLVGFASVFAILGGLPFGAWGVWQRYRRDALALALALAVGTLVYPATLALRFTTVGAELSSRALAFLFIAISFLLAVGLAYWWEGITGIVRGGVFVVYGGFVVLLFLGGIVTGYGPSVARLPGPYLVVADERSIEPQGLNAATWTLAYLGADHRIGADRINGVLMGTYGEQFPVTELASHIDLSPIFFSLPSPMT